MARATGREQLYHEIQAIGRLAAGILDLVRADCHTTEAQRQDLAAEVAAIGGQLAELHHHLMQRAGVIP